MKKYVMLNGSTFIDPDCVEAVSWDGFTGLTTVHLNGSKVILSAKPHEVMSILESVGISEAMPKIEKAVKKATTNVRKAK